MICIYFLHASRARDAGCAVAIAAAASAAAVGRRGDNVHPLALGPAVLEPELDVLLLQTWELLPVREAVQLFSIPDRNKKRGTYV